MQHILTSMSKRQGPQTQIGCGMRNRAQYIFNGVYALVYENLRNFLLVMAALIAGRTHRTLMAVQTSFGVAILDRLMIDGLMLECNMN